MVAFDCESPPTFGTLTVVRTVDVVDEGGAEVEGAVEGAAEVDGGPFDAPVDSGPEVWLLRTSATIATTSAATAIIVRRSGMRVPAVPAITRALKTRSATRAVATIPATTPAAKVTMHSYKRRRRSRPKGRRSRSRPVDKTRMGRCRPMERRRARRVGTSGLRRR